MNWKTGVLIKIKLVAINDGKVGSVLKSRTERGSDNKIVGFALTGFAAPDIYADDIK